MAHTPAPRHQLNFVTVAGLISTTSTISAKPGKFDRKGSQHHSLKPLVFFLMPAHVGQICPYAPRVAFLGCLKAFGKCITLRIRVGCMKVLLKLDV